MPRGTVTLELPRETLTALPEGEPDPKSIRRLCKELYDCAAYVDSDAGGGNHGHLGMVMPNATYQALPGIGAANAWVDPVNPNRPVFAAGTPAHQITNDLETFKQEKEDYTIAMTLEANVEKMILEAVPKEYLNALAHPLTGFTGVRARQFVEHLIDTYGTIQADHLEANENELEAPWDLNTPTEGVFDNAQDCQHFAEAGGDPISDPKVIRTLLKIFEDSGVMDDACSDWRKKPAAQRTLANMRIHFRTYNQERMRRTTTREAGFGTANAAQTNTPSVPPGTDLQALAAQLIQAMANNANGSSNQGTRPSP